MLKSLASSTIAVSSATAYENTPAGYMAAAEWYGDRRANEPDKEYAERTRAGAGNFVTQFDSESADVLFSLAFPEGKHAA